ncbi:hypothetical protein [Novosphingopyxis sp.]
MSIVTIVIALVIAFLAFRFITGAIKFVVILGVIALAIWLVTSMG